MKNSNRMSRMLWGISVLLCVVLGLSSCSDDDKEPQVVPSATGTLQDKDGNEYHWVRIGKLDWMTENLRCDLPFYEDTDNEKWGDDGLYLKGSLETSKNYYDTFGNYYTWQEAMDDAPEGWRLPTDDDFKALERELGMKEADLDKMGWRSGAANLMTQRGEGSMLDFRYGGEVCWFSYEMSLYHPYDYGYYWTGTYTTASDEPAAYARQITPRENAVNRLVILQEEHLLSVRYVRDAQ